MLILMIVIWLTAFTVSCLANWWLTRAGAALGLIDLPNARSLHARPMPRSGGLGIWAGILCGVLWLLAIGSGHIELAWIGGAMLLVGIVSLIDDRSHVPAGMRLLAHFAAGGLLVAGGAVLEAFTLPGLSIGLSTTFSVILTLILIVWLINLYNFMDGIDGLAGGMAVFGFATLGLLGWLAGDHGYAILCGVVAAAAAGFLLWNFPPAWIFMGDSGSSALGLLAAAMCLWADRLGLFPFWVGLLAFAPFIIDATVTLVRRQWHGQRVWEAHRDHAYQRLARAAGWGHRQTVVWAYGLMLLSSLAALTCMLPAVQALPLAQWLIIALVIMIHGAALRAVRRIERLNEPDSPAQRH